MSCVVYDAVGVVWITIVLQTYIIPGYIIFWPAGAARKRWNDRTIYKSVVPVPVHSLCMFTGYMWLTLLPQEGSGIDSGSMAFVEVACYMSGFPPMGALSSLYNPNRCKLVQRVTLNWCEFECVWIFFSVCQPFDKLVTYSRLALLFTLCQIPPPRHKALPNSLPNSPFPLKGGCDHRSILDAIQRKVKTTTKCTKGVLQLKN